jgi:TPR repeat protein
MKNILVLAAFLLAFATPLYADLEAGNAAYARGDYAAALKELRPLAERGNARAQVALALMYEQGHGVPENKDEALRWYRKAADQGHADAQFQMAVRTTPMSEAAKWFRKAADQGHAAAQYWLALLYADGKGVVKDEAQAAEWFRKAAAAGHPTAAAGLRRLEGK